MRYSFSVCLLCVCLMIDLTLGGIFSLFHHLERGGLKGDVFINVVDEYGGEILVRFCIARYPAIEVSLHVVPGVSQ